MSQMLESIEKILQNEKFTTYINKDDEIDVLNILLEIDGFKEDLILEIMIVPDINEQFENTTLIQFFTSIHINDFPNINLSDLDEIESTLNDVNFNLPMGHFILNKEDNMIYFKYNVFISKSLVESQKTFIETTWHISYLIDLFTNSILLNKN